MTRARMRSLRTLVVAALVATSIGAMAPVSASAADATTEVASAVPSKATPAVQDGVVYTIAKVGNRVFLGGTFTSVANPESSTAISRPNILAFDAATGQVDTGFAPALNGSVEQIIPGPDDTVYVTGNFSTVNGKALRIVRLIASTGAIHPSWKGSVNKATKTAALANGVLYVGGMFDKANGVTRKGFAELNPVTGATLTTPTVSFSGRHGTGSMQGDLGPRRITVNKDGTKIVVIGNFTSAADSAGTVDRDQIAMLTVSGGLTTVNRSWRTLQFTGQCANAAFDSWVRDVDADPTGTYFAVATTGASGTNTDGTRALCDSATRWEFSGSGTNVMPTWTQWTGRDTLLSVSVDSNAVYVGGHQRWMNNPDAEDAAGPGAVPRPGVAALDPASGTPLAWNPGRNPRGAGAYAVLAADTGVYVGSDTEWIGNYRYKRLRIAHFPRAGAPTSTQTGTFPGRLMAVGGFPANSRPDVLYRVNAAGGAVAATDGGPSWAADNSEPSPYRNSGSTIATYLTSISMDSTVPAGTPSALFSSERYDTGSKGDTGEMKWAFPVPAGTTVNVRLYMADRTFCWLFCTNRRFSVDLEGSRVLNNLDLISATGNRGTMRQFSVVSDGSVNIDFVHEVNNPLINAIEIIQTDPVPQQNGDVSAIRTAMATSPTQIGGLAVSDTSMDWSTTRGAFLVGSKLFYGKSNNTFVVRSFDGDAMGPEEVVDPYRDAEWSTVDTGSGTTQTYLGVVPGLYSQLSNVTSMFYANSRIYYTLSGQSAMYSRPFNPDSGVMGVQSTVADGKSWVDVAGAFVSGNSLYFASRSTGSLSSLAWDGTKAVGSPTLVSAGSWAARSLLLVTTVNKVPAASFTLDCPQDTLTCTVDGSASADPDGSIVSWAWDFGDGTTSTDGATASHTYTTAGTRQITLVVTDNEGATATFSKDATPTKPPAHVTFRSAEQAQGGASISVPVPADAQPGDALVLVQTINMGGAVSADPTGWTLVKTIKNSAAYATKVYTRTAADGDAGSAVTMTYTNLTTGTPKSSASILAYSGLDSIQPVRSVTEQLDTASSTHTTPVVDVTGRGTWAVSLWVDKASVATTAWTTPAEVTVRSTVVGGGGGAVTHVIADSGADIPAGSYGGLAATTTSTSTRGMGVTILLNAG